VACGIFPDQGSNLCPLHWQENSYHCPTRKPPPHLLYPFICRLSFKLLLWCLNSSDRKESAYYAGDLGSVPVGKLPWGRAWQPTPVFVPGESHRQRSLVGHSPCRKELNTTELLSTHTFSFPWWCLGPGSHLLPWAHNSPAERPQVLSPCPMSPPGSGSVLSRPSRH